MITAVKIVYEGDLDGLEIKVNKALSELAGKEIVSVQHTTDWFLNEKKQVQSRFSALIVYRISAN